VDRLDDAIGFGSEKSEDSMEANIGRLESAAVTLPFTPDAGEKKGRQLRR
jgi:hypothetical protein